LGNNCGYVIILSLFFSKLQVLFGIFRLKAAKIAWQDAFLGLIGKAAPI
jgi:hypothetical protein